MIWQFDSHSTHLAIDTPPFSPLTSEWAEHTAHTAIGVGMDTPPRPVTYETELLLLAPHPIRTIPISITDYNETGRVRSSEQQPGRQCDCKSNSNSHARRSFYILEPS